MNTPLTNAAGLWRINFTKTPLPNVDRLPFQRFKRGETQGTGIKWKG